MNTSSPPGGYSLVLTVEQFEELNKHNVFAGIDVSYFMQDGNYVIKLTQEQYDIYQKNRHVAPPMTTMQYNITLAASK